jgi:hypothetical protein
MGEKPNVVELLRDMQFLEQMRDEAFRMAVAFGPIGLHHHPTMLTSCRAWEDLACAAETLITHHKAYTHDSGATDSVPEQST